MELVDINFTKENEKSNITIHFGLMLLIFFVDSKGNLKILIIIHFQQFNKNEINHYI